MAVMMGPSPDPRVDEAGYVAHCLRFARRIAAPCLPFDEVGQRALILKELRRGWYPGAAARQMAAVAMDGDSQDRLAGIIAPSLVIHGTADPLFPLAHGQDTAAVIPGACLLAIEGMGHDLSRPFHAGIIDAIVQMVQGTKHVRWGEA